MKVPSHPCRIQDLSESRKRFLRLMQEIDFGRVEALVIRAGDPVLDPSPKVVREVKFGGQNGPRCELALRDFALRAQIIELFREFDRLQNGVIEVLTVKHGLPFNMHVNLVAGAQ